MVGQVVNDRSNSQNDIQKSQLGHNDVSKFPSVREKGVLIPTIRKTLNHRFNFEMPNQKEYQTKSTVKAK